ncbi:MAG: hypothetical protein ACD_59C00033G0001 [uncultured bacterium]|nr:MAG: hypothetical protein ACD_59C00033G0001 [uncultured bacterium]
MKKIKFLRLASFIGNIGDNANHAGSAWLHEQFIPDVTFIETRSEIREFYWKKKKCDEAFAEYINTFDMFVIGGGNYLELWPANSETGTSLNFSKKFLDKIKVPISLYSLGCDDGQGADKNNIEKFKAFIDYLLDEKKVYISMRNDGSSAAFLKYTGSQYSKHIDVIPDGGFFLGKAEKLNIPFGFDIKPTTVAINLAGDMLETRFSDGPNVNYNKFLSYFADVLMDMINREINVIFIPHIYKDLRIINDLLCKIEDQYIRTHIKVAPYIQGIAGMRCLFSIYEAVDMVLAMRFHANVCPIGMNIPTIGLACYPQIEKLYKEIGLIENMVRVNCDDFRYKLMSLICRVLNNKDSERERLKLKNEEIYNIASSAFSRYKNWINNI